MQKLLSIQLPNNRGELAIHGIADVLKGTTMFQVLANGLVFCETPFYEDARAVWEDVVALNTPAQRLDTH